MKDATHIAFLLFFLGPCLQMLGMKDWNLDSTGMTILWLFDQQAYKLLGVY